MIGEDHAISGLGCGGTTFGGFIVIPMSIALIGVYSYHVDDQRRLAVRGDVGVLVGSAGLAVGAV